MCPYIRSKTLSSNDADMALTIVGIDKATKMIAFFEFLLTYISAVRDQYINSINLQNDVLNSAAPRTVAKKRASILQEVFY